MAADVDGLAPTTVFGPSDVFFAIVHLSNAPNDTELNAIWTAVNVEGEAPNTAIDEVAFTSGSAIITFDLANTDQLWPNGSYKVDIYLNGKLERTLTFQVQ